MEAGVFTCIANVFYPSVDEGDYQSITIHVDDGIYDLEAGVPFADFESLDGPSYAFEVTQ